MNHIIKFRLEERRLLAGDAYVALTVLDFETEALALDEKARLTARYPHFYEGGSHELVVIEVHR